VARFERISRQSRVEAMQTFDCSFCDRRYTKRTHLGNTYLIDMSTEGTVLSALIMIIVDRQIYEGIKKPSIANLVQKVKLIYNE